MAAIFAARTGALLVLALLAGGCGPEPTETFPLRAGAIGDDFIIRVRVPPSPAPAAGWPLVVLLDADWHFQMAQARLEELVEAGTIPQALLVGIGYPEDPHSKRIRDTAVPATEGASQGGRAFLDFIEATLLPEIERRHAVDVALARRILIGHSRGGLLAAQALFRRPQLFGGLGLAAPAFWPDDWRIFTVERDYAARNTDLAAAVVMKAGFQDGPQITVGVPAFARKLESRSYPGLDLVTGIVPDATHTSILPGFIDEALARLLGRP
jgi:uncharacterized protein